MIAAGVVGSAEARSGGASLAALGRLPTGVAFTAAAVLVAACRVAPGLARRPWLTGPLYGVVVFLMMNYVVIPLSAIGRTPGPWSATTLLVIALHVFGVGPRLPWRRAAGRCRRQAIEEFPVQPGLGLCGRPASRPTAGAR